MKRNKFSLSHYFNYTCDMGYVIPIQWHEVIPGDTFQLQTKALVRVSPLLAPIMTPVRVRISHWFVPYRLIWEDSEDFFTGGEDGTEAPVHPYRALNAENWSSQESSLVDYIGIPPVDYTGSGINVNVLPIRAYQTIFNEYIRDQQLTTEANVSLTSGADNGSTSWTLQSANWEKDYFTTARTSNNLGDQVVLPISGEAPVLGIGKISQVHTATHSATTMYESDGGTDTYPFSQEIDPSAADTSYYAKGTAANGYPAIFADLASATGADLNDLATAIATLNFQEARNTFGSRYTELLRYYGVTPADSRLQRPEYLGGGSNVIQFSEVLEHSSTGTLGDMAGHGISLVGTKKSRRFMEEHGIIMTLMSVVPKHVMHQGLHRKFNKTSKFDYYTREFAHIGDQEILNKEVYVEAANPDDSFGYTERYREYRECGSRVSGEFRSSLDYWTMHRDFGAEPSLNSTFVQCSPTKRVLASQSTDALYVTAANSVVARRPIPKTASKTKIG